MQVQLDDNYTTAGSRGGKQLLSVWELIRWFSSFGKEGGGQRGGGGGEGRREREQGGGWWGGGGVSLFGTA